MFGLDHWLVQFSDGTTLLFVLVIAVLLGLRHASDPDHLADTVRAKVVVDGRNCLDIDRWNRAGWRVYALGRSVDSVNQQTLV